jgi:ankyrin repeat protein
MNAMDKIFVRVGVAAIWMIAASAVAGPLHEAVRKGDMTAAERQIAQGAAIEGKDAANLTPLIVAALAGRNDTVAWLIGKGADPRGRDGKGFTALHAAAHVGALDIVKNLIERGLDVDDRGNPQGLAPLHMAAERGHRDVVAALLAAGADVNLKTGHGRPAIWLSVLNSHPETTKILREAGGKCPKSKIEKYNVYCLTAGN